MTEPIFKAPLPPEGSGFSVPPLGTQPENPNESGGGNSEDVKHKILPYLWYVLGGTFVIGLILGLMMAGGDSAPVAPTCPLRHIRNSDIQGHFRLCGQVSRTEPCVLYIMNTTQYEKAVEDFYPEAQRLTERSIQLISIENPVYSKLRVPPGLFAEIKIPSLR